MVHKPSLFDEILSDTSEHPAGPPCIVHTDMEKDVYTFAKGFRIAHRDAALGIRAQTMPEGVLLQDIADFHGLDFCRLVILEIARMNHVEVGTFAAQFSLRYKHNVKALLHSLSQPLSEVFTRQEQTHHGTTFLNLVLENCRQGMACMERLQDGIRSGAITKDAESPQSAAGSPQPQPGPQDGNAKNHSDGFSQAVGCLTSHCDRCLTSLCDGLLQKHSGLLARRSDGYH